MNRFLPGVAAIAAALFLVGCLFAYGGLLSHGRVVQDRAAKVDAGRVTLASGEELAADYLVLATGSMRRSPAPQSPR